jgi:hypothetical protein
MLVSGDFPGFHPGYEAAGRPDPAFGFPTVVRLWIRLIERRLRLFTPTYLTFSFIFNCLSDASDSRIGWHAPCSISLQEGHASSTADAIGRPAP